MKVLLDTNVLLDYLTKRDPFYADSRKIMDLCSSDKITGCMAAHSVMNMFYILRKEYSLDERRAMLLRLCKVIEIEGIGSDKIISALNRLDFSDVEDCLQDECASSFGAQYIVTRNLGDYSNSKIPAILPADFLQNVSM